MAGYTPMPRCEDKYDDIYGFAILMCDDGTPKDNNASDSSILLVSMDFLQIPGSFTDYIRKKIHERYGIDESTILVHATHTHKSFDLNGFFVFGGNYPGLVKGIIRGSYERSADKYKIWITNQLIELVGRLFKHLRPAEFAWKKEVFQTPLALDRVRRRVSEQPISIIGLRDPTTKKYFGLICSYGIHPTTIRAFDKKLSAEYPGRFVEYIERETDNEIRPVFFTGPAGNMAPNGVFLKLKLIEEERWDQKERGIFGPKKTYVLAEKTGELIAIKALEMLDALNDDEFYEHFNVSSNIRHFKVPMRDFSKHWSNTLTRFSNSVGFLIKRCLAMSLSFLLQKSHKPNFPTFKITKNGDRFVAETHIQSLIIQATKHNTEETIHKNLIILGVPGELFGDLAQRVYRTSPMGGRNTLIFQAANDWIAYLFSLEHYIKVGGYEPFASFSPVSGTYVVKHVEDIWQNIKNQKLYKEGSEK